MKISAIASALLLAATAALPAAGADDYPTRPVRIIVGFAPGGAPDLLARTIADKLSQHWKQSVLVENRTGSAGNIAMVAVAKAEPDGTMLALVPIGNAAVNPSLFSNLPYAMKDFEPITQIATVENVLVVSAKSQVKTLDELITIGRSRRTNITYATPGAGSLAHLAAELLGRAAGFPVTHVGYRGVTPALTDVMRGEVSMMFAQVSTAKPLIDAGELRPLGVASKVRSTLLPEVPAIAESGGELSGFEAVSWYGLMAPVRTPATILEKLHAAVVHAINQPDAKAALAAQGLQPVGNTPAAFAAIIAADTARWGKVIRDANISGQ